MSSDSSNSRISASCFWDKFLVVGKVPQPHFLRAELDENLVQLRVVIHVFHAFLARDLVERRLGDVDKALSDQLRHLPVEKRQQQRADVRAVHVRIGHDDDLVVAQLFEVERAFAFAVADARADGGDHGADFGVLQHLVQARLLDVDQLAANRQDRLELPVAALLGRAAGGITLDDVQLGVRRVAVRAIGQLAGQAAAGERAFAHRLARLAGRLARPRRQQALFNNLLGDTGIRVEMRHQPVIDDGRNDAVNFRVDQLDLGLRLKPRVRQFHAQHADQPFAHVIAGNGRVLFLQQVVLLGVLVDGAGQRRAEAGQMRAAVGIGDRVGEAEDLVVVAVGVLQHAIHEHVLILAVNFARSFASDRNGLGMQRLLAPAELPDELLDAVLVKKRLGLLVALVREHDLDARIQKRQLAQAVGQDVELELGR